mmetsp:Transcript_13516/g.34004  ORF Transcript_13516/g.34004 Transcript_13516/m.34004 type:complete len:223 (-) Transcript_13516:58-726(-)
MFLFVGRGLEQDEPASVDWVPVVAAVKGEHSVLGIEDTRLLGEVLKLDGRDHGGLLGLLEKLLDLFADCKVAWPVLVLVHAVNQRRAPLHKELERRQPVVLGRIVSSRVALTVVDHQAPRVPVTKQVEHAIVSVARRIVRWRRPIIRLSAQQGRSTVRDVGEHIEMPPPGCPVSNGPSVRLPRLQILGVCQRDLLELVKLAVHGCIDDRRADDNVLLVLGRG